MQGGSQLELIYGTGELGSDKGGPGPPVPFGAFRSQLIQSATDKIFSSLPFDVNRSQSLQKLAGSQSNLSLSLSPGQSQIFIESSDLIEHKSCDQTLSVLKMKQRDQICLRLELLQG